MKSWQSFHDALPICKNHDRGSFIPALFGMTQKGIYTSVLRIRLHQMAFEAKLKRCQYRPKTADCQTCVLKKACASGKSVRTIMRSKEEDAIAWAMRNLGTAEAEKIRKERLVIAEGKVGEAKVLHRLRRATCRGLEKVTIQVFLTTTIQNLKRLVHSQFNNLTKKSSRFLESFFEIILLPLLPKVRQQPQS